MARFHGVVGFAPVTVEVEPGVWEEQIIERPYFGDLTQNMRQARESENTVNTEVFVQNSISIVADGYASDNFFAIRYVMWMGKRWAVSSVTVQRPRLLMRLGEVYNGPTP